MRSAIAFAVFQLVIAAWNVLPSQVVRGVHVGFLLLLAFGLIGNLHRQDDFGRALGLAARRRSALPAGSTTGSSMPT